MFNSLRIHAVNLIATGGYLGVFLGAYLAHIKFSDAHAWWLLISAALLLAIFASIFNYWRLLKISEAAISSIGAAAQGYIELQGIASYLNNQALKTPYQGISCVYFRASAYADVVDDEGNKSTRLLQYDESKASFRLTDGTGECIVNPAGAEILSLTKTTQHKNNHRYVEEYLPTNARLYVIGHLDTRHDYNTQQAVNEDVAKLLTALKADKAKLLNSYDQNRDGQIDMQEWQQVRRDAQRQVENEHALKAQDSSYLLAKPAQNKLFLISALSPQKLRARLVCWHRVHLGAAAVLFIGLLKFM